ncbi:MAG: hypothetical protein R3C16_07250 [Hyphomonadaceae bacterium]
MPEKTPGGPLPKQTGTQDKGKPQPGGADAKPVKVNPNFKDPGGKGGGGGKK